MTGWTDVRRAGVVLVLAACLGGCAPDTPDAVLDEYLTRVARVAEGEPVLAAPSPGPPYPARRALDVDIPARTIDVAEFFDLHGCDMGALIGFRNSPLGRVQTASQRLGYEAAWLAAAERCGADAAEWMRGIGAEKRTLLPALFWNATFAAEEMRTALGGAGAAPVADFADVLRGLNDSLTALLDGRFDLGNLEARLARLRQASWVGHARGEWSRWRRHLDAVGRLVRGALPEICLTGDPTPRAERLQRVFTLFYVERIQPDIARRMRAQEAWLRELERLSTRLADVRPPAFTRWYRAVLAADVPGSEWQRTRQAVIDHAEAWQHLFAGCGIEPFPGLGQD